MKIAFKSVEATLKKPDAYGAFLLYGPDNGVVRDREKQLRTLFLGDNPDPLALVSFEEGELSNDSARLGDEVGAFSMMAPKRVILVRDATDKTLASLQNAAEQFNNDVLLIILANELTPKSKLRAYCEKASNIAAIACYRDEVMDVRKVISAHMSKHQVSMESDALDYLCQQFGNDRYVTYQELDKIILYLGETPSRLTLETARQLVDYNKDMRLDDIVLAVASRNLKQLDAMLMVHGREGAQPVAYIRALLRYFFRIYQVRAQMQNGASMDQAINSLKPPVFFKQQRQMQQHIQSWSLDAASKAIALLGDAERLSKTSDIPTIAASSRVLFQITQVR